MIDSSDSFLALYDYTLFGNENSDNSQFLFSEMFSQVVFFSSSPGGGKSSLFHLFSPEVLNNVWNSKEQHKDLWKYLSNLEAVDDLGVRLLGIEFSCARNYSIIEDVFDKTLSQQVFFALLNVRLLKESLKSILNIKKATSKDLNRITFSDMPEEITSFIRPNWNGQEIYDWACDQEKNICSSIDNMDYSNRIDFIHSYLFAIQMFEADRILFDGQHFVNKVVYMLDDVHKLTKNQRALLRENVLVVRDRPGVWLAQRSYALEDDELLGRDALSGRDYYSRYLETQEDIGKNTRFSKSLLAIADRRVKAYSMDIPNFASCVSESVEWNSNSMKKKINKALTELKQYLREYMSDSDIEDIIESDPTYENIVLARVIKIIIERHKNKSQLVLFSSFLGPSENEIEKAKTDVSLKIAAQYYLSVEYSFPFYYGMDKLQLLSFGNVYQYLSFCGAIFERKISYKYDNKKKHNPKVSAEEQDQIVKRLAQKRWIELDVLYSNSSDMKKFILNIIEICLSKMRLGTASYAGGTFTGIGFSRELFNKILKSEKHNNVRQRLAECVSSNLLKQKEVSQGSKGEKVEVFYLNRWICVHFNLPLAYGGWKPCKESLLTHLMNDSEKDFKYYYLYGKEQLDD